jgi:hypothetical protein
MMLLHVSPWQAAVAAGGAGAPPFKALKGIQLCSTITVRGAFSSDVRFSLKVRPANTSSLPLTH